MGFHQPGLGRFIARIKFERPGEQFRGVIAGWLGQTAGIEGRSSLLEDLPDGCLALDSGLDLFDDGALGIDLGERAGQLLGQRQIAVGQGLLDIRFHFVKQIAYGVKGCLVRGNKRSRSQQRLQSLVTLGIGEAHLRHVFDGLLRNIQPFEIDIELRRIGSNHVAQPANPSLLFRRLGLRLGFGPFGHLGLILGARATGREHHGDAQCEQQMSHLNFSSCCW